VTTATDTSSRLRVAFPIVEAKLLAPARRPGTIDRARLARLLSTEPRPPVVAVVAPAGYGKTTVLAEWVAAADRPVAWLTLDDLDNDPAVLVSYLAAAFHRVRPVAPMIMSAIRANRERVLATAVPQLATELHRWDRPGLLVLDDLHRIGHRVSLDVLTALIDHLPAGFQVAVAGRAEPDLPLSRYRARRDLLEIGPGQLALDEDEVAALTSAAGFELSRSEARALTARTEGWAAGVYLAVLARKQGDQISASVGGVSGHEQYIRDYFRTEFELDLRPDDVTVLTRTAILETVTPSVAAKVSGDAGADERIRSLARANLFIQEIGTGEPAFRYHNLLRDFLLDELEQREPGVTPDLHHRAAAAYWEAGSVDRAIAHAFASGHRNDAARYVTASALPTFYSGKPTTLDRWFDVFEQRDYERHPPLVIMVAWVHLLNGRAAPADRLADLAERLAFAGVPEDGSASFESNRAMLRAIMARNGPQDVLANAELAASQEPPTSRWRANALLSVGIGHFLLGDVDAADEALAGAAAARPTAAAAVALAKRAGIAIARGDWNGAERHARESLDILASGHHEEIGIALATHAVRARVAIHRGDIGGARRELVRAQIVRPQASYGMPAVAVDALLELARAYLAISDPAGANVALREAETIIRHRPALGVLARELLEVRRRLGEAAATLAGSSTLTAAELRLLPLLPTYLSFQDIADRLVISRNTVKTHAMSIYGKLQASSRGEAVERAVELGLLEPYPGLDPRRPGPTD
jgi:LuxR family maltose regulon positive regulatory protein